MERVIDLKQCPQCKTFFVEGMTTCTCPVPPAPAQPATLPLLPPAGKSLASRCQDADMSGEMQPWGGETFDWGHDLGGEG